MSNMFAWLSVNSGPAVFVAVVSVITCIILAFAIKEIKKSKEEEIE